MVTESGVVFAQWCPMVWGFLLTATLPFREWGMAEPLAV